VAVFPDARPTASLLLSVVSLWLVAERRDGERDRRVVE
jgi:hypothetical protein